MKTPTLPPATEDTVLDDDVLAWLDQGLAPEPLDAAAEARVKARLLRRIAAESTPRHPTLRLAEGEWQPFAPGVAMKVLHRVGVNNGDQFFDVWPVGFQTTVPTPSCSYQRYRVENSVV